MMIENLNNIIALMSEAEIIPEQMCSIQELRERLAENELIISVIGQFKRGKTTLVNSILKDKLLPAGIVPLTSVVTQIQNGDAFKAVVHFRHDSSCEVSKAELSGFISEQENQNNHKNVDFVELWYPCNLLRQGVTLVDTPGIGSMHQHNTDTSYSFVQNSDAVLFMLSVDSPVNELEREFLLQAKRYASKFYFAVNKVDTISAADRAEYLIYCQEVIKNILKIDSVTLHPISALTGDGIAELIEVIRQDFSSSADQILQSSISIKTKDVLQQAISKLELYVSAISFPIEMLNEKTAVLTVKQQELDTMADETQLLLKQKTDKLVEHIDCSMSAQLPAIEKSVHTKITSTYEETKETSPKNMEQLLSKVMESALRIELERLNEDSLTALNIGYENIVAALNMKMQQIKQYVAQMVEEFFAVSYQYETPEYSVSERNDFFFRINHKNGKYFFDIKELTHLLPRHIANPMIYRRVLAQVQQDLLGNKNNMVYNYRYKMQESIRTLCADFKSDITATQAELSQLLHHARMCVETEGKLVEEQSKKIERIKIALIELEAFL